MQKVFATNGARVNVISVKGVVNAGDVAGKRGIYAIFGRRLVRRA
jgi:hypothetical protein